MSVKSILPFNSVKFRENSADSVVYHLDGSTPVEPFTLTISRILPAPRKGNLGTMKLFFNIRSVENIGTIDIPRYAPTIAKLETSCPVGASKENLVKVFKALYFFTKFDFMDLSEERVEQLKLFMQGHLPSVDGIGAQV